MTTVLGLFVFVDGFKKAFVALRKEKAVVDEVGLLLITKVGTGSELTGYM